MSQNDPVRVHAKPLAPMTLPEILLLLNRELERSGYGTSVLIASPTPAGHQQPVAMILNQTPLPLPPAFAGAAVKALIPLALPEAGAQAEQITGIALKLAPALVRTMKERTAKQATILGLLQKLAAEAGVNLMSMLAGGFKGFGGGAGTNGNDAK